MKTSQTGVAKLKKLEGFRQFAYPDPASPLAKATRGQRWGFAPAAKIVASLPVDKQELKATPWTAGYGETMGVDIDTQMTEAQASARLLVSLEKYEAAVNAALTVLPNQHQFDACVLLAYNIGVPRFMTSTVVKAHNRGDFAAAARAFGLFNKAGGVVDKGLVGRRAQEAAYYLLPDETTPAEPIAQTVDAEMPMTASPINRASVIAGGTAAVASVTQVLDTVNQVKTGVDSLGQWLVPVLLLVVVGLCAYVVYQRYQQRKGGWA